MEKPELTALATKMIGATRDFVAKAEARLNARFDSISASIEQAVTSALAARPPVHGRDAAELEILPSINEGKSYRRGTWASHNGGLIRAARQTDPVDGGLADAGWVVMVEGLAGVVVLQGDDKRKAEVAAILTSGARMVTEFDVPLAESGITEADLRDLVVAQVRDAFSVMPSAESLTKLVREAADAAVRKLPPAQHGKDANPVETRRMVDQQVAAEVANAMRSFPKLDQEALERAAEVAVAKIPLPPAGKDAEPVDVDAIVELVLQKVPKPVDGKDADLDKMRAQINDEVAQAIAKLPVPKDGKDADPVLVASLIDKSVAIAVARAVSELPPAKDGKDADPEVLMPRLEALVRQLVPEAVAAIPKPKDGADASPEQILEAARAAVAELPRPKDGQDGKDADPERIEQMVQDAVARLPKPKDGENATPDMVRLVAAEALPGLVEKARDMLAEHIDERLIKVPELVHEAVEALPKPADGKSVTLEDVRPMVQALVEAAVDEIPDPKDGKDADPAETRRIVEQFVAEIPKPQDGKSVTVEEVMAVVDPVLARAIEAIPKPKDGESVPIEQVQRMVDEAVNARMAALKIPPGEPGRDAAEIEPLPSIDERKSYRRGTWACHNGGLIRSLRTTDPIKDRSLEQAGWAVMMEGVAAVVTTQGEDLRSFEVAAMTTSGTKFVTTFSLPVMLYREVWREGLVYAHGDIVTWGGSAWHSQVDNNTEKPGNPGSTAWKLMVKHGRDGKDGNAPAAKRETVKIQ